MKIKRITALILALIVAMMLPIGINAATVSDVETGKILKGNCGANGSNVTYSFDTDTCELIISGTGAMKDYAGWDTPWASYYDGIENVIIENGVTSIGAHTFYICSELQFLELPQSIESIGYEAFAYSGLTSINIPANVNYIGTSAFSGCYSLTGINVDEQNSIYSSADGVLYDKAKTELLIFPRGKDITGFVFDKNITRIGDRAFENNNSIISIDIPEGVTSIGDSAFAACYYLSSVTLPSTLTKIGSQAFYFCSELTYVKLPANIKSIGEFAFGVCGSLSSITLPANLESLGYCAFYLTGLTQITLPANLKTIGGNPFVGCMLSEICVDEQNTAFCTVDGVLYSKTKKDIICFPAAKDISSYVIDSNVTRIASGAFVGCSGLTDIEIPNAVTSIGDSAFVSCSSLTNIEIPDSVTDIGSAAFSNCENLMSVKLSEKLTEIKEEVFCFCENLTEIKLPSSLKSIGERSFSSCLKLAEIEIPVGVTSLGKSSFLECESLSSIKIPSSVTSIGRWAFDECSNLKTAYVYSKNANFEFSVFGELGGNLTIYGYKKSTAQSYASKNGHWFVALNCGLNIKANNGGADVELIYDDPITLSAGDITIPGVNKKIFLGLYNDSELSQKLSGDIELESSKTKTLYSDWMDVGDRLRAEIGDKTGSTATTSCFDLFGAQYREKTENQTAGLRFCLRASRNLISEIKKKTGGNVECGFAICTKDNMPSNTELTVGMKTNDGNTVEEFPTPKAYYSGRNYLVYVATVSDIPDDMLSTEIVARPYIKYTDLNGVVRYYYFTENGNSNLGGGYYTSYEAVKNAHTAAQN